MGGRKGEIKYGQEGQLEVESQLQELGVDLGNYNMENEFCTLRYSLCEGGVTKTGISFYQRVEVTLEWTIKYFTISVIAWAGVLGGPEPA
jgi:hypothetical protein